MLKPNPYLLVDKDRHGWSEIEVAQFERARRRGTVDTFERCRSYNAVLNFLNKRPAYSHAPFLTFGEAAHVLGVLVRSTRIGQGNADGLRERYIVARYFARKRFARPEAWN